MIRIHKVDAQISINSTPARQRINQPAADFNMHTEHAKVEIKNEQVKVKIDQQQCFNESGLMDYKALTADAAQRGQQAVLEGIGRIAEEGNMLAAIENKFDVVAEIAFNNTTMPADYNVTAMPGSRPDIQFVGGTVDIEVHEGRVTFNNWPNRPKIDADWGSIEFSMKQKPSISFEYVGNNIDAKV